jgi:hypothetical protein
VGTDEAELASEGSLKVPVGRTFPFTQAQPALELTAGRSLIWRWANVDDWLTPLGLGDGAARPTRAEATLIDAMLLGQGTSRRTRTNAGAGRA